MLAIGAQLIGDTAQYQLICVNQTWLSVYAGVYLVALLFQTWLSIYAGVNLVALFPDMVVRLRRSLPRGAVLPPSIPAPHGSSESLGVETNPPVVCPSVLHARYRHKPLRHRYELSSYPRTYLRLNSSSRIPFCVTEVLRHLQVSALLQKTRKRRRGTKDGGVIRRRSGRVELSARVSRV